MERSHPSSGRLLGVVDAPLGRPGVSNAQVCQHLHAALDVDPHALCRVSEGMILAGTVMCTFFRKSCTENVAETGAPRDVCPPCYPLICFMLSVLAHLASFLLCLGLVIQQRMVRRAV
jgi:hypothetical protein